MFNKSLEVQRKEEARIDSEYKNIRKSGMYHGEDVGYDLPETLVYQGVRYKVEPAWKLVVDSFDELIGSVELSHRQGLGYAFVSSYFGNPEVLDFRFARVQDNIDLKLRDNVKDIYLNSANIRYTYIDGIQKCNYDITSDSDLIDFVISLKYFIKNNKNTIASINFQGMDNQFVLPIIVKVCIDNGVSSISFIDKKDMNDENNLVKKYSK